MESKKVANARFQSHLRAAHASLFAVIAWFVGFQIAIAAVIVSSMDNLSPEQRAEKRALRTTVKWVGYGGTVALGALCFALYGRAARSKEQVG
jgi:uncharacterized membrane protein